MSTMDIVLPIILGIIILLFIGWLMFKHFKQKRSRGGNILNPSASICWDDIKDSSPDTVNVGDILTYDRVTYIVDQYINTQSKDATIYIIIDKKNPSEKFTLKLIKNKNAYDKEVRVIQVLDRNHIFTQCPDLMRATAYRDVRCIGANKQVMIMPYLEYSVSEVIQKIHSSHSESYNVPTFKGKIIYDLVDIILCLNNRNLYYLDIKLANIMFTSKMQLVLIDLGSIFSPADFYKSGGAVDRTYIPPGFERLHSVVPTRTDLEPLEVYIIGLVILQLVDGQLANPIIQKTLGVANQRAQEIHDDIYRLITDGQELTSASLLLLQIAYMCLDPVPAKRPTLQTLKQRLSRNFLVG